ncbi:MAG: DNA-directed RNA polymerase subunit omega [Blastocatellia bacterium]|nr:DNA-directed RNA polymerase subunit omega [Blastocatellia bacterium]
MKYTLEKNKYRIVLLAAQRAKQLQHGARQRVNLTGAKSTRIALTEIQQGLIGFDFTPDVKTKG